jgi:hypothetical protein
MNYAICNFDVAISFDKKRLRKWAKRQRFSNLAQFGHFNSVKDLKSPKAFQEAFGPATLHEVDQGLIWRASMWPGKTWGSPMSMTNTWR